MAGRGSENPAAVGTRLIGSRTNHRNWRGGSYAGGNWSRGSQAVGTGQWEPAVGLGALGTRELGTGNLGTKTMGAGARGAGAMGTCQVGTGAVETRPVELRRLERELWGPVQLEQASAECRTGTWLGHFIGLAVTIEGGAVGTGSWNRGRGNRSGGNGQLEPGQYGECSGKGRGPRQLLEHIVGSVVNIAGA